MTRILLGHKLLLLAGAGLAVTAFVAVAFDVRSPTDVGSRSYEVGVGKTSVLVDTPKSQAVDLSKATGSGIQVLTGRAELLADISMTPVVRDAIAQRVGLRPAQLIPDPVGQGDAVATERVMKAVPEAHLLRSAVPDLGVGDSPIIAFTTRAPTAAAARRLADAAVVELRSYLAGLGAAQAIPSERQAVLVQLTPATAETETRGARTMEAAAGAAGGFAVLCVLIVVLSGLAGALRRGGVPEPA